MVYLDNHLITINSQDSTQLNGTMLSNIYCNFKGLLKDDVNILRSYITLLNAQIPVSFYVIDATNNVLSYLTATAKTITVPIGNYNANTLATALSAQFLLNTDTITVSINPVNGILSFVNAVSTTYYVASSIATILGLSANLSGTTINCQYPLNLLGKSKLIINSAKLNNVAYSSLNNGFATTIATIPINVPPYSLIQYTCQVEQQKNVLVNRVLDGIDIQILDTGGKFINFNNCHWSITLVLSIEKMDANKFHIQDFNNYLGNFQPIQPEEIQLNPPDKDLEFLQS